MTCSWTRAVIAFALFASAACAANEASNQAVAAGEREQVVNSAAEAPVGTPNTSAKATNAAAGGEPTQSAAEGSILAWSRPTAGSTVSAPVNELVFHFSPPARLGEVTVTGPEGTMPMMVTAVGEVEHYSLPVSGLGPGRYTVDWKASSRGVDHNGSFSFVVR